MNVLGTLQLTAGGSTSSPMSVANGGAVSVTGSLTQTGGTMTLASGSNVTTTTGLILNGGILTGLGTITGNVTNNSAQVIVGDSGTTVGILTITGNYTQGTNGILSIKIGGPAAGTQYDQLAVGGMAMLDGTLNVTLIGGFVPSMGDTFQPLTSTTESGMFASLTGDGTMFSPSYAAGGVTLTKN